MALARRVAVESNLQSQPYAFGHLQLGQVHPFYFVEAWEA
jgi:hypothetical protein